MAGPMLRIAAFGDSLTEGWGLARDEAMPAVLKRELLRRGRKVEVLNFGISGETSGEGLLRIGAVLDAKPDLAVVEFGANDYFQHLPPALIEDNLDAILRLLVPRVPKVLLVGIEVLPEFNLDDRAADYVPIFPRLAEKHGVPLYPNILAGFYHVPELLLADGTHPNAAGVRELTSRLLPHVERLLDALEARG